MATTLYELTGEMLALQEMMGDPEVDPETVADTAEAVKMELVDKLIGCSAVDVNWRASSKAIGDEIKRLKERKDMIDKKVERLEKYMFSAMKAADIRKVDKDPRFKISIQRNGGQAPLVVTGDIPAEFMIPQDPVPDNKAIRDFVTTFGCDWAHLGERGETLRIK